jgi:hypothetical protein
VLIGVDDNGVWVLYDVLQGARRARRGLLVERLLGVQEKASEARPLALDYAAAQTAFALGERDAHLNPNPLPKPVRVPMRLIHRHVRAAAVDLPAQPQDLEDDAAWFQRVARLSTHQNSTPTARGEPRTMAA